MVAVVAVAAWMGIETRLLILLVGMTGVSLYKLSPNIRRLLVGSELRF
jgi:hypothetical protein